MHARLSTLNRTDCFYFQCKYIHFLVDPSVEFKKWRLLLWALILLQWTGSSLLYLSDVLCSSHNKPKQTKWVNFNLYLIFMLCFGLDFTPPQHATTDWYPMSSIIFLECELASKKWSRRWWKLSKLYDVNLNPCAVKVVKDTVIHYQPHPQGHLYDSTSKIWDDPGKG